MGRRSKRDVRNPLPANARGQLPVVAIVGRPNVGKSTLFNRFVGQRLAIVEDIPGVTRDRHYADAQLLGRDCVIVDTGGFDPHSNDPMKEGITEHVKLALVEADIVVCVLDVTSGPMSADREAVRLLRSTDKPVLYAANKADSPDRQRDAMTLYELGIDRLFVISAEHALGLGDLEEAIVNAMPDLGGEDGETLDPDVPRLAIVGRPNAGKSSLTNRLLGEDRQLVDDRPGTTVDSIDTLIEIDGDPYVLIDTAGIRRKRSVRKDYGIEGLGVMKAIKSIERCQAVVLMIDAQEGVAEQDAHLAGLAMDRGRALVICLNKMDLLGREAREKVIARTKEILAFAPWAPVIPVSAKTGRGTHKLIATAKKALAEHVKRIPTAEMNRFFEQILDHHPPPTQKGKVVRLYYVTQASTRPPTFVAITNLPKHVHFSYQRYVVNSIRKRFGFEGVPVRVFYRKKKRRDDPR